MNKVRLYSFRDLMQRLTHPDWRVALAGEEFFFIPRSYLPRKNP
jgi:hypothetical protein